MNKRGTKWLSLGIFLTLLVVAGLYFFSAMVGQKYDSYYRDGLNSGKLANPISGMSIKDAHERFNEDYVHYFLVLMKAYNLKNTPVSNKLPEFEVVVNDEIYRVFVISGSISVTKGKTENKDIIIRTTQSEILGALQNPDSLHESFKSGASKIEYVSDRSTLLYKGYDAVFSRYTAGGITGNLIRSFN